MNLLLKKPTTKSPSFYTPFTIQAVDHMDEIVTTSASYIPFCIMPPKRAVTDKVRNIIPDHEITGLIGRGGTAEVYTGTGPNDSHVAIKVPQMKFDSTVDEAVFDKFEKEAGMWKNLDHPNIVKFFSAGDQPIPHIIMEIMDGGSLCNLMKKHSLTVRQAAHIMLQILEGLSYAHRMATVHRDLKPENILFTSDGTAKITDWGIGKFMAAASLTKTRGTKGTVLYCAPEQFDKKKYGKIDWQTDIFQIGVTFYEMLTGKNPFAGEDMPEVYGNIINLEPARPSSLNPEVPESLDKVVMRAIAKAKEHRWRSADVMLFRLKKVTKDRRVTKPTQEIPVSKDVAVGAKPDITHRVRREKDPDKECLQCGNYITPTNRKLRCKVCRKFLCQECEGWIDKLKEYKGYIVEMKYPLCESCYDSELMIEKESLARYYEEQRVKREKERRRMEREAEWNEYYGMVTMENAVRRQALWSAKLRLPVKIENRIGMQFTLIPPGEFDMGSSDWKDSQPVHRVRITSPFYMGTTPVTQGQWEAVMLKNPSYYKNGKLFKFGIMKNRTKPQCPVESVSWNDCQRFLDRLNKSSIGYDYRLATEAQWEYAARSGSAGKYCFGDLYGQILNNFCWYTLNSYNETHPVGQKERNLWGLYDVHGNVWEWCGDGYDKDYYHHSPKEDPPGHPSDKFKVIRGGSWDTSAMNCRLDIRNSRPSEYGSTICGLRVVSYRKILRVV